MRYLFKIKLMSLILIVSLNASANLFQVAFKDFGLEALFISKDIAAKEAKTVLNHLKNSFKALNHGRLPSSSLEVNKILKGLGGSEADGVRKRNVQRIFNSDLNRISKKELIQGVDSLIFLANKYGTGNWIMSCGKCTAPSSAFRYGTTIIKDKPLKKALALIPSNPVARKKYIKKKLRGWDNYSSLKSLSGEDEKTLALFLTLADRRSGASANQKAFIASIREISRSGKKVDLINPDNSHQLWKLVDADLSDKMFGSWAKLLKDVAQVGEGSISKKKAFYSVLRKKAGKDPILNDNVDLIKSKGCYFK